MKKVFRYEDNETYWDRRWQEAGRDSDRFDDMTIYPIRYAEMVMTDPTATALEIGCGLGRVLKHYRRNGFPIVGIERSPVAVARLQEECADLDVRVGDVLDLPFPDASFDIVMAFGVFHNLPEGLEEALAETSRCLKPGGRFCISMRPDNIEMWANEVYWNWRNRRRKGPRQFHKLLVAPAEFRGMLARVGLRTDDVHYARNVSMLYRIPFLRASEDANASEDERRSRGYRLNGIGSAIDGFSRSVFPYQTANVLAFVGTKGN